MNLIRRNIPPASGAQGPVLLAFVINALAVWRISSLLVNEDGPYYIFRRVREKFGFQYYADGDALVVPDNNILGCVWCTSIWVALLLFAVPVSIRKALALSAIACILEDKAGYGHS